MKRNCILMAGLAALALLRLGGQPQTGLAQDGDSEPLAADAGRPLGDPFSMRASVGAEGFVGAAPHGIPRGIRVVGIIAVAGGAPVGALEIPGSPNLHFVSEGDIIEIDQPADGEDGARPAQLYLLVKSISHKQIEIAPRTRPQDVRIYR
jgi:hypothetical protein